MTRQFALDQSGVKRLKVTYLWNLTSARVYLDGKDLGYFAEKTDFERGAIFKLPDGRTLLVKYGPIEGAPFLKGVHLLHNGVPVPGFCCDTAAEVGLGFYGSVCCHSGGLPRWSVARSPCHWGSSRSALRLQSKSMVDRDTSGRMRPHHGGVLGRVWIGPDNR